MLVLLGGWLFLGDQIGLKQFSGMALAVVGMVAYGITSNQCVSSLPVNYSLQSSAAEHD